MDTSTPLQPDRVGDDVREMPRTLHVDDSEDDALLSPHGLRAATGPAALPRVDGEAGPRSAPSAPASVIELAHFDSLTRLPNRESFVRHLDSALQGAPRGPAPALVVIDIDRFRLVNESHGFHAGDAVIREAGATLAAMTGDRSLTARLAQNTFAMFLPANASRRTAAAFARGLARRFSQGFRVRDCEAHFTLSVGISLFPEHGREVDELLCSAESATRMAKAAGGNAIRLHDPEMTRAAARKLALENALRSAVDRQELRLAYQPFVDLSTGHVVGAEALLRWDHPVFGTVSPSEFIGLAEESGLIGPMGQWALEQALRDTKSIRDRGHRDFRIAVNVSPAQFRYTALAEEVLGALERAALPPDALELEITESLALDESARTVAALAALRRFGVRLAIDDFGTGFASLSSLKRFPFDTLKVDKGFIAGLPGNREDCAIVASLAALARGLGVMLHAEGIETSAQARWLRDAGCSRAQGFHFGTPESLDDLERLLDAK